MDIANKASELVCDIKNSVEEKLQEAYNAGYENGAKEGESRAPRFKGNFAGMVATATGTLTLQLSDGDETIEIGLADNIRKIHAATTELLEALGE